MAQNLPKSHLNTSAKIINNIPSTLKGASSALLLKLLKSINGKKSLILDSFLVSALDHITKVQQLKACDVEKIFKLDPREAPKQTFRCVYLVRASIETTKIIADHIKADQRLSLHKEFWIIFVPRRLYVCDKILEREGVYGCAKLLEFPMGLLPLDTDLLSLELTDFYSSFFLNSDQTHLYNAAISLVQLQRLCGSIPVVWGQGRCAEKVIAMMKTIVSETEEFVPESQTISHLILFDRDVDYIPVLLTQRNFEGILDETYGIKGGRIAFGKDVTGQDQDIRIVLNNEDVIFREIRDCHFSFVLGKLKENAKQLLLKQDLKKKMSVSDMKEIIAQKVKTAPQEKLVHIYVNACEDIIKQKKKWSFKEQLTTENCLIDGSRLRECIAFIEETINKQAPWYISLRLLCLLSVTQDGINAKDYKSLATQFLQSYGFKHMVTLHNLKKLGLCVEQAPFYKPVPASGSASKLAEKVAAAVASIPKQSSFKVIAKKMSLVPSTDDNIDLKNPTDMSYVFSGVYMPLVGRLTEQVVLFDGFNKLDDALKLLPGKTVQYASPSKLNKPQASSPSKIVVVYFLGGVTYAEASTLRLLAKLNGFRLIIATTSVINGNSLMKMLIPSDES